MKLNQFKEEKKMDIILLIGRILFSIMFIMSGVGHLKNLEHTVKLTASTGAPFPKLLSIFSSLLALFGGLSIAFGFYVEIGAVLLLLFLLPVTFMVHRFWAYSEPMQASNHQAHFMKNIGLIGGLLIILYFGPGPLSLG